MKLLNFKNKKNGFTLVETIAILSVVSFMTIGIFAKYNSIALENKIDLQTKDLKMISSKINGAYQTATSLSTLNNTTAIAIGLVPSNLINGSSISSKFGTTLTLSPATVSALPGYEIRINNIPVKACSLIATTPYGNEVGEIWINGINQKTTGLPLTSLNIASIVQECRTATSISFRNKILYNIDPDGYNQIRPLQTDKHYIPTIASSVISSAPSCSGGAVWNASFCACPAGTEWTGVACMSNVTITTNCAYGTGSVLGNTSCSVLPETKVEETIFNGIGHIKQNIDYYEAATYLNRGTCDLAGGYWDSNTNICGGILPAKADGIKNSLVPDFQGGRYLPQPMNTEVSNAMPVTLVQGDQNHCAAVGGNWDGKYCNFCPSPTTIDSVNTAIVDSTTGLDISPLSAAPVTNPNLVSGHAASSLWDTDRCVTPGTPGGPPFPQTVIW